MNIVDARWATVVYSVLMNTRKKLPPSNNSAVHVRLPEPQLLEIEEIATLEGRDTSDTMRCLLRLGVSEYKVTGTLYAVEPRQEKRSRKTADDTQEHRNFMRYLRKILKAASEYSKGKKAEENT